MRFCLLLCVYLPICLLSQEGSKELNEFKNYDFRAGEKIIFEDNGNGYTAGIAPTNWTIEGGKAIAEISDDETYLSVKEYYTKMSPKYKLKNLPDTFTLEYDTWLDAGYDGNPGIEIHLLNGDKEVVITPNKHELTCVYPNDKRDAQQNPEAYFGENKFYNRWVHISIACFKKHLVVYLDQYKLIDQNDCVIKPLKIGISGNCSQEMKILLRNVKLATGIPKKLELSNGKFITHAIKFDVNKFSLKPESMPVLKEVVDYMRVNPMLKFEIGGHTDSDGTAAGNLELSNKRAGAVKNQLVSMGIAAARLEAKGYGQTKPLGPNLTAEDKANNRRVEFIVIK